MLLFNLLKRPVKRPVIPFTLNGLYLSFFAFSRRISLPMKGAKSLR
jgi:hypothetical protein